MNLMSLFGLFNSANKPDTAPVARERLQILLAHERATVGHSELVATLREEILAVITKHVSVPRNAVQVKMEHNEGISTLAVDVEIPNTDAEKYAEAS
jgi:cell division topological specificity factor